MYRNEYKTKCKDKSTTNEYRHFIKTNFIGLKILFVLIYLNENNDIKWYKFLRYYIPKGIINNYNVIINWKNFFDQPIDSDIKQYEEISKLTTGQGEDYATWCLLDYEYIQNHYRLIAVDLSRQKELDAYTKSIQQTEFVGELKKLDANENARDAGNDHSMFVFTILEKYQRDTTKIF